MEWKEYWNQYPGNFAETDFFKQVGKTVAGQPVTPAQFMARISDIKSALHINPDDIVLDMCCGNGLITTEIAMLCKRIVGVDFSETLVNIARKYNAHENVNYVCASVLDKDSMSIAGAGFTKIYMYESLQHFTYEELPDILSVISILSIPTVEVFIGGIPNLEKIWDFYNTEEKQKEYMKRKSENREAIGTWWDIKYIVDTCREYGFAGESVAQNKDLDSAYYRFDVRLVKLP